MKQCKFYYFAAYMFCGIILFLSGCSKNAVEIEELVQSDPNLKMALIKSPGEIETYRLKTFSQRKVSIDGPARENAIDFQGGQTTDKIEMLFDSEVQSVNAEGNAIQKITIKELKYFAEVRNTNTIDFDSTNDTSPDDALTALIGHSYFIEVTPSGQVAKVIGIGDFPGPFKDIPSNLEAANNLLSEKSIMLRHNVPLPDANDNEIQKDKTWSNVNKFNFGSMGSGSYKRTFKLEKIETKDGNLNAIITMNAIPSIEGLDDSEREKNTPAASSMTDVRLDYTGSMELDVTNGKLLDYHEELVNEWIIIPPGSNNDGPPSVLNMKATRSYDIKKIK